MRVERRPEDVARRLMRREYGAPMDGTLHQSMLALNVAFGHLRRAMGLLGMRRMIRRRSWIR